MITALTFYLFAALLVLSALCVVLMRNPVHSVLFLIMAFFNAAGLFLLLGAEFLAMMLVIVYVGAVAVLFLFVVMMLNIKTDTNYKARWKKYMPMGLLIGGVFLFELAWVFWNWEAAVTPSLSLSNFGHTSVSYPVSNIESIGLVLYTDYVLPFLLSGFVLLVAMIATITLTLRKRSGVRRQNIMEQTARRRVDAMEIVKVESGEGAV
jgi:NADH-quinone oxidoreductase subunit J